VPVATLEVSVLATTAEVAFKLPALALPVTASEVNVPTDVMLGCAAVTTVPAVVAFPLSAPTNVVAVMLALAKLALIPVLITAELLPFALLAVNVGYTVVAVEVFCSNAAAFVAEVAVPLNAPTKVVAVMLLLLMLAKIPVTLAREVFAFAALVVPTR
jgi:hypothetical protein